MARLMGDNGEAFRAVVVTTTKHPDGREDTYTSYQGPYATPGAAKSRLTWAKRVTDRRTGHARHLPPERRTEVSVIGHVEKAVTNWERVD